MENNGAEIPFDIEFTITFILDNLLTPTPDVKPETSPASKASIDALPIITVTEGDCAICLDEMNVGGESREMPCKHRFHSNCIVKWLGIHGSCPVCRFMMPDDDDDDVGDGSEDGRRQRRRTVSLNFIVFDPVGLLPEADSGTILDDEARANYRPRF